MFDFKRHQLNSQVPVPLLTPINSPNDDEAHQTLTFDVALQTTRKPLEQCCPRSNVAEAFLPPQNPKSCMQATQERLEQRIIMLEETVNRLEAENANTLVRCPHSQTLQSSNPQPQTLN